MTVYVDDVRHQYGRMIMCHMWADTEAELFAMADRISVARKWVQRPPKASWVHFDVSLGKKAEAIRNGAVLTDRYGPIEHEARRLIASGRPNLVAIGERKLARVERARAQKADA